MIDTLQQLMEMCGADEARSFLETAVIRTTSRIPAGLRVLGVEITGAGIFELDRGRRTVFIDRSTIRTSTIRSGFVSERPLVAVIVGLCMSAFGALVVLSMTEMFDMSPSRSVGAWVIGGGVVAGMGVIIMAHSIRRGFYLELETSTGKRKLTIGKAFEQSEMSTLIEKAHDEFGYDISVDLGNQRAM